MKQIKTPSFSPSFWLCLGGIAAFSLGIAGGANAAKEAKPRAPQVEKRLATGLETKLGKPLTDEQTTQVLAAQTAHQDAVKAAQEATKAANEKYVADIAKATGLTEDDVKAIVNPPRMKPAEKKEAAPAAAPAAAK